MTEEVIIPQIGESASELTVVQWLKAEGDHVQEGEFLFELDTEKSILEIASIYTGTLTKILAIEGEKVAPLQVVAKITTEE